jgi:hypothetical protein
MKPYVDYIPLEGNLSNLNKTLHWVQENPQKVREIASSGRLFYECYLSFERMEEVSTSSYIGQQRPTRSTRESRWIFHRPSILPAKLK